MAGYGYPYNPYPNGPYGLPAGYPYAYGAPSPGPPVPPPAPEYHHHRHSRSRSRSGSRTPEVVVVKEDHHHMEDALLHAERRARGRSHSRGAYDRDRAYDDARRVIEDEERRREKERQEWERELEHREKEREEEKERWKADEEKKAAKAKRDQEEAIKKAEEKKKEEQERIKEIEKKYEERKKEEAEKKKNEEKKFKDEYETKLRKDLKNFGISEHTIDRIVTHETDAKGHAAASGHGANSRALIRSMDPDYPWPRIHLDYVDIATLRYFDLDWVESPDNPNYIIIRRHLTERDLDRVFEHTRRLRKKEKGKALLDAPKDPEFEFVRRRPSQTRRKSTSAREKSPARERSSDRRGKLASWMFT